MTDRPIIFSAPMVRALLAGRKTQTRRILRAEVPAAPPMDAMRPNGTARHPAPYLDAYCGQPMTRANPRGMSDRWCWWTRDDRPGPMFRVPHVPGDRLYVRERAHVDGREVNYAADMPAGLDITGLGYRPSIHMPRWASRLTLVVTQVRIQRLQDISEADAIAEGATSRPRCSGFADLYDGWCMDWSRVGQPSRWAKQGMVLTESDISLGSPVSAFAGFINGLHDPFWSHKGDGIFGANPWVVATTFTVRHANIDTPALGVAA